MIQNCPTCNGSGKVVITTKEPVFYNNPENLSSFEISSKMLSFGYGPNRNKRFKVLASYDTTIITKEQFIKNFTTN